MLFGPLPSYVTENSCSNNNNSNKNNNFSINNIICNCVGNNIVNNNTTIRTTLRRRRRTTTYEDRNTPSHINNNNNNNNARRQQHPQSNQNTQEVKNERILIWSRSNNPIFRQILPSTKRRTDKQITVCPFVALSKVQFAENSHYFVQSILKSVHFYPLVCFDLFP